MVVTDPTGNPYTLADARFLYWVLIGLIITDVISMTFFIMYCMWWNKARKDSKNALMGGYARV